MAFFRCSESDFLTDGFGYAWHFIDNTLRLGAACLPTNHHTSATVWSYGQSSDQTRQILNVYLASNLGCTKSTFQLHGSWKDCKSPSLILEPLPENRDSSMLSARPCTEAIPLQSPWSPNPNLQIAPSSTAPPPCPLEAPTRADIALRARTQEASRTGHRMNSLISRRQGMSR